jgi:type II secretory pathway pseudopilin PulG
MFLWRTRDKRTKAAFTLTEAAIVLGIAGMIFAVAFGTSKFIYGSNNFKNALQQVFTIASNMQTHYNAVAPGSRPTDWPTGNFKDFTSTICGLGLLPGEMVNGASCAAATFQHALGGQFKIITGAKLDHFALNLYGLSKADCVNLVLNLPLSDPGFGFTQIGVNGVPEDDLIAGAGGGGTPAWNVWPITTATVTGWCGLVSGNVLGIFYVLHP